MGKRNIAVIFGGKSNENEISVITGTMAANVLKSGGDTVIPVYISREGTVYTGDNLADINIFKNRKWASCPRAVIAMGGIYSLNKRGKLKKFRKVDVALARAAACAAGWSLTEFRLRARECSSPPRSWTNIIPSLYCARWAYAKRLTHTLKARTTQKKRKSWDIL